ncbi:hypothetical protein ACFL6T_05070 [Candidatus Zixiibacteriota bacterium]
MTEDTMNDASSTPDMPEGDIGATGSTDERVSTQGSEHAADEAVVDLGSGANEEQLLYAKILEKGMFLGLVLLLVAFALYVLRVLPSVIPIEELSEYWTMPVHDYLEAVSEHYLHQEQLLAGWKWLSQVGRGDFLNFIPIAILSAITIICYAGITPVLIRKKDRVYAIMAIAEVVILTLAASGLLAVGH